MIFKNLKSRIKKNEGYSNKPYKDQLGFYTIGYGHLIKKKEYRYFYKTFSKKYFENIFELDFKKSAEDYYKKFNKKKTQTTWKRTTNWNDIPIRYQKCC